MKIVCDACQAKYSISDDKVQGKVFKIRCKKCSNIIVVRGGASEQPQAAAQEQKDTRVYDYGYEGGGGDQAPAADDAVWHLVVNQDQVGPMTVAEVQQRFAAGEIDGDTFTWREGFGDWLPLSQVEPFAALVASGSTTSASSGGGGAAAIGAMFGSGDDAGGTSRSDPGDLFASASASSRSSADEDDGGGDLFGAKPGGGTSTSTSAAANAKLRGERNENSVLFSLNNLAQLASDKPAMSAPSGGGGHATGAAGGEGSGLIDIRSMASAYMGGGSAGAMGKPQTASAIGSIDDLPVFGGGGFSEPAVLVPTVRASANNNVLYMMIAAVSLLAVVAIIMVVIMMKGKSDNKSAATTGSNAVAIADTGSAAAKPDVAGSDTTTGAAAKPAVATVDTATGSASGSDLTAKPDTTTTAKPDTTTPVKTTTATVAKKDPPKTPSMHQQVASSKPDKKTDPTPTATSTPKADSGGCDEVSCVLNNYEGACCSKFRKGGAAKAGGGAAKPAAGGGADLPDGLDRGMISSGIANVKARVSACGDKSPAKGKVKVHVKVGGDGKVAAVNVESSPDEKLGACVAAAVQKASFSKTQSGGSFSYPFVF